MKYWTLEPRDVALFRDARPFGVTNSRAYSLDVPRPSTIAGFLRTHVGSDPETGEFTHHDRLDELIAREVRGPVLVELGDDGNVIETYFPAPADAIFYREELGKPRDGETRSDQAPRAAKNEFARTRYQLCPRASVPGEIVDEEFESRELELVDYREAPSENPGKPSNGPLLWSSKEMAEWLRAPAAVSEVADIRAQGIVSIPHETRTHVSIDGDTGTAKDGHLFAVDFVRMAARHASSEKNVGIRRMAIVAGITGEDTGALVQGSVGTLGGERRVAFTRTIDTTELPWPKAVEISGHRVRVILVTPAIFKGGSIPEPSEIEAENGRVVAAAVGRAEPISGWDYAKGGPKPTCWMVPAGSVFWLDFDSNEAAASWASEHGRGAAIGQKTVDGFGQILIGDGGPHE